MNALNMNWKSVVQIYAFPGSHSLSFIISHGKQEIAYGVLEYFWVRVRDWRFQFCLLSNGKEVGSNFIYHQLEGLLYFILLIKDFFFKKKIFIPCETDADHNSLCFLEINGTN